ncbi:MAG TPA: hypothetical protein VJP79_02525 [Nitrososphaera sp.]|nr:hypothetical protein [Nitrososphaera sp.]
MLITVNGAKLQTLHQGSVDKKEGEEEGRPSGIIIMITITLLMMIIILIVIVVAHH